MQRPALRANVGGVDTDIPTATWVAGQFLRFNGTAIDTAAGGGGGGITGPGSTTVGNVVSWNSTTGAVVADAGFLAADVVRQAAASVTNGNIPQYNSTTGRTVVDSGIKAIQAVTNVSAVAVTGRVPQFTNTLGNDVSDSGLVANNVMQYSGAHAVGDIPIVNTAGNPPTVQSGSVTSSNVVLNTTGAGSTVGRVVTMQATTGTRIQDGGVLLSDLKQVFCTELSAAAAAITTTGSLQTVVGLAVTLPSAGTYLIRGLVYQVNSVTPRVCAYGLNSSAGAPTRIVINWVNYISSSAFAQGTQFGQLASGGTGVASGSKVGTNSGTPPPPPPTSFEGSITVGATTTLQVLASTTASSITVQAASYIEAIKL